jgi:hypothetical protein
MKKWESIKFNMKVYWKETFENETSSAFTFTWFGVGGAIGIIGAVLALYYGFLILFILIGVAWSIVLYHYIMWKWKGD